MKLSNSKVLVTGGAGFIGSNLIEVLLRQGNQVVCLDNLSTGFRHNIEPFFETENFRFIEGDIRDLDICRQAVSGTEYVLHQAALGSVPRSIKDPKSTNDVNIGGFLNMLIAARDEGVKRFVYAASSSTYGDHQALPKVEHTIGKPLSPYAITKFVNELYADMFHKLYGMETVGLRYFNVFGRRQDPHGAYAAVIPLFIRKLISHEPPVINGDGTQSRDFTYVENVIQMNQRACLTDNPEAVNEVYNTAVGDRTNLNQLAGILIELLSAYDPEIARVEVIHGPERAGDIMHSLASVDKARKLLGYKPTHNLRAGLEDTIDWYYHNLK